MDDQSGQSQEQPSESGQRLEPGTPPSLEPLGAPELERFALARLERFATLLADPWVREVPAWHRLARHAVAAAYRDCAALGLKEQASAIVEEAFVERV